jgi:hypothetical protein
MQIAENSFWISRLGISSGWKRTCGKQVPPGPPRYCWVVDMIRLFAMIGLGIRIQVNVKLAFGITTNSLREKFASILEDLLKAVALSWKEMHERIGNLIWVVDFKDVVYVVTRSLVKKVFGHFDLYRVIA